VFPSVPQHIEAAALSPVLTDASPERVPEAAAVGAPRASSVPELARFHAALRELEEKRSERHVRVLWLGDSHGQADFWSGQLRRSLAERFGSGGPGFLHLGYKNYRHDGVKLEVDGRWRMRPKRPVWIERQDDGVFGLGGLMMSGYADGPRVELSLSDTGGADKLSFDLCYRFHKPDDQLEVTVGDERRSFKVDAESPVNELRHVSMTGPSSSSFVVRPIGRTDLCGVVVETDPRVAPGVVLDTLAINGARFGTMLAWDETAWTAEVARRAPDLVILEMGTNEAGDGTPKFDRVADDARALLERVRKAAPASDCLIVSPTDRADAESRTTTMRATLMARASELGCAWFDAWEILGGEGAMAKLREETEPKVQADGIHLTIKGYRELGATMFAQLMKGY
jgi:lysophospholipase L1-like esterase